MAEPYFTRLQDILRATRLAQAPGVHLDCRHFFTGAALYAHGHICATLTPKGLALKLPEGQRDELLRDREGRRLRYFAGGPIKREYIVLGRTVRADDKRLHRMFQESIRYVTS